MSEKIEKEDKELVAESRLILKMLMKTEARRKRWRFFTLALLLIIAVVVVAPNFNGSKMAVHGDYVARVNVSGLIFDEESTVENLNEIAEDDAAKALVVFVDSPGGTMVAALELFHALRRVAEKKPVVTVMGTTAASAGYLTAIGGDHMLANEASLTGSIGVFMPLVDASELSKKIGVISDDIASGPFKTATSPFVSRTPNQREYLQELVNRMNKVFFSYVTQRRNLSEQTLVKIRDGRAVAGIEALEMGLVDGLGNVLTAREWLEKTHKIAQNIPMVVVEEDEPLSALRMALSGMLVDPSRLFGAAETNGVWALHR